MEELTFYNRLVKISEGDESMSKRLRHYDEHDIIENVRFNQKRPENTILKIVFNEREFYELFYNEGIDLAIRVMGSNSYYYGYGLIDDYWARQEWDEGYLIGSLTDDTEKIKTIVRNIDPTFEFENRDHRVVDEDIASLLSNLDESSVDDIVQEYSNLLENSCMQAYREIIKSETENKFLSINIFENVYAEEYYTTVKQVIKLYDRLNIQDTSYSLYEAIKLYCEDNVEVTDNLYEIQYDIQYDYFDGAEFKRSIERYLDKLLEVSETFLEDSPNKDELIKMFEIINKGGGFKKWIDLPGKEKQKIKFEEFNKENNSIIYLMYNNGKVEKRSVKTVEELNNAIHQPELFESFLHKKMLMEQLNKNINTILLDEFYNQNKELFNKNATPVTYLVNAINDFNKTNPNRPKLDLDKFIEMSKGEKPVIKLDLFFINNGKMEKPLSTANLEIGKDLKFTLTKTPDNNLIPGVKVNF